MWINVYTSPSGKESVDIKRKKVIFEHPGGVIMKTFKNEFESIVYSRTLIFALKRKNLP